MLHFNSLVELLTFFYFFSFQLRNQLVSQVRKSFVIVGLLGLLLSPFIFLILITYFILRYGEELRNKPNSLGFQAWSRYAHWKFREFNEFPHDLEDRLNMAVSPATSYVNQFTSYKIILLARFSLFLCGSIVVSILLSSFFVPSILENDIFLNRNGLWWLAVCGSILAICRAFIPDDDFVFQPEHYFDQVSSQTHYLPPNWQENCRSPAVLSEFNSLFEYRLYTILLECFSILFVPLIFLFSLPGCAEEAVLFMYENTEKSKFVGDICTFANFDFEKHGNSMYGSSISAPTTSQSCDGKMEQSFMNFTARNPKWIPSESGKNLINNMAIFVEENMQELPGDVSQSLMGSSIHSLGSSFMVCIFFKSFYLIFFKKRF